VTVSFSEDCARFGDRLRALVEAGVAVKEAAVTLGLSGRRCCASCVPRGTRWVRHGLGGVGSIASRRTGSRSWPTPRSRSANLSAANNT
jgi:hypothetical protein